MIRTPSCRVGGDFARPTSSDAKRWVTQSIHQLYKRAVRTGPPYQGSFKVQTTSGPWGADGLSVVPALKGVGAVRPQAPSAAGFPAVRILPDLHSLRALLGCAAAADGRSACAIPAHFSSLPHSTAFRLARLRYRISMRSLSIPHYSILQSIFSRGHPFFWIGEEKDCSSPIASAI